MRTSFWRSLNGVVAYPRLRGLGFALVVLALAVAGCVAPAAQAPAAQAPAAQAAPTSAAMATGTPPLLPATGVTPTSTVGSPAAPAAAAALKVSQNDKLGQFLVDDKGMTLYLYTKDTPDTSNCYDKCATAWPPLLSKGQAMGGSGIDASLIGTTTRKDGTTQVTYNHWPLYYWFKDKKAGDTTGQDVGGVWYVISPKGDKVEAAQAEATAPPAASGSAAAAGQTVKVDIKNFAFAPQALTVAVGTTVEWTNDDNAAHTVTADNGAFDSGNLDQGAGFKFTFTQAGTFAYFCKYHGGKGGVGMAGQIIVK